MEFQKKERRLWSKPETLAFLECYAARQHEFVNCRKKKYPYANILLDMENLNVLEHNTTPEMLETKMKSLLRAYKSAKDNAKQTGAAPCIAPYIEQMDEIFGSQPIISNKHTLNLRGERVFPLEEEQYHDVQYLVEDGIEFPEEVLEISIMEAIPENRIVEHKSASFNKKKLKKSKMSLRERLHKNKLEVQKQIADEKAAQRKLYFERKEESRERRHQEKMRLFRETFQKNV